MKGQTYSRIKRRSRPSKALMGRQLKEATERQEAAQHKAAAKFADAQRLQPLTWAEAQRIIEFIIEGKIRRFDIYDSLPIVRIDSEHQNDQHNNSLNNTISSEKNGGSSARPSNSKNKNGSKKGGSAAAAAAAAKHRIQVPEPKYDELEDYVKVAPNRKNRPSAPYFKYNGAVTENIDQKVEYDLDDQDAFWLKALNDRRRQERLPLVSESVFETIIDKLEKAAFFEALNSGRHNDTGVDEDAVCSICLDGDCLNANAILFCDMCNLAVHQECYGVPYIPEGQWLCRRCLESPSIPVACCLCPNKGGAFKRTDDGRWAHVVCALWIPEVSFSNSVFLEPIEGVNNIPPARWRLRCYLCKKSGVGAAIQCHRQHCYSAFHVTCAIQAGLFMRIDANPSSEDRIKRTAYCDTHTPPNSDAVPMISHGTSDGERSSSNSPNAMGRLMKKRQKIRQARKLLAQSQACNTQVVINVPTISDTSLNAIAAQHTRVVAKTDLMRQVLAYWQLKRRSRCGVPLIRRLHVSSSSSQNGTDYLKENPGMAMDEDGSSNGGGGGLVMSAPNLAELANSSDPFIREHVHQLRTFRLLRQNLERVRLLIELVHKRERMKRDIQKITLTSLDHQLCPFKMVLRSLLGKLRSLDKRDLFETPVSSKSAPTYYRVIKKPMSFSKMEEKLDDDEYHSIDDFERDFNLIIDNCLSFNPKTTVFHRAAVDLRNTASPVFSEARQYISGAEFDFETGMYQSTLLSVPSVVVKSSSPATATSTTTVTAAERRNSMRQGSTRGQSSNDEDEEEDDDDDSEASEDHGDEDKEDAVGKKTTTNEPREGGKNLLDKNSSPPPRTRRAAKVFPSPNSIEVLLPAAARDGMSLDEQLSILHDNLEAAVRTGKTTIVTQLRREIQSVKRRLPGGSGAGSRSSSVATVSPPKQECHKMEHEEPTENGHGVRPVTRHRNSGPQHRATTSPAAVVKSPPNEQQQSEHPSRLRRRHSSIKAEPEQVPAPLSSSRTTSPMSGTRSPTPGNGLLMIASPGKLITSPRGVNASSTPMANSTARISTRRSAAQAGIQLPSVFGASPPPYKHRKLSSTTNKPLINGRQQQSSSSLRTNSPTLGVRVSSPTMLAPSSFSVQNSPCASGRGGCPASAPQTPTLQRSLNGSFDGNHNHNGVGNNHNGAGDSTPTSPPSTPGVNRRTAVLFKKRSFPAPLNNVSGSHQKAAIDSNGSSPTIQRCASATQLLNGGNGVANGSPTNGNGALTVNNHHNNHHGDHDKLLRRLSSSSAESFRSGSSLQVAPLTEFAAVRASVNGLTTPPRRLSPRIPLESGGANSVGSTTPAFELSDSDEELLADLRRKRRSSQKGNLLTLPLAIGCDGDGSVGGSTTVVATSAKPMNKRSRRSSAASATSMPSSSSLPYCPRSFDVVWVRASSPACPGLVVDPASALSLSTTNGASVLLKRLLPTLPPNDVVSSKPSPGEHACLVFHFDAKQSWRWVPVSKLEPLDTSRSLNELHLPPIVQDAYRRACLISSKLSTANNDSSSSRSASPACATSTT